MATIRLRFLPAALRLYVAERLRPPTISNVATKKNPKQDTRLGVWSLLPHLGFWGGRHNVGGWGAARPGLMNGM
jgi:hypothetical protein